jgi:CelD/BcsL family acetyltransferase involved in cellulose biosynthesis
MSEPDLAFATAQATLPAALDTHALSVIGVMVSNNGLAAFLRSSDGEIARVSPGDVVYGMTVTAIGDAQVMLTDSAGRTQALQLPHS